MYWPKTDKKRTQTIEISEFKTKCLSLIDQVNKTKTLLCITKRGETIAEVIPATSEAAEKGWVGSMAHRLVALGLIAPLANR